jgi:hypothetical protein
MLQITTDQSIIVYVNGNSGETMGNAKDKIIE